MTAPQLTAYVTGSTTPNADQLNTFMQSCDTATQMRSFVGITGLSLRARGISVVNDGLGGAFHWNPSSTSSDDNLNTIVPTGSSLGAWIRDVQLVPAFPGFVLLDWYGGGPSVADNTAAWNKAVAVSTNILFGAGTYRFASGVSIGVTGNQTVCLFGAGPEKTFLQFSGTSDGVSLNLSTPNNSFHIRDMTFLSTNTNVGAALKCNQAATTGGPAFTELSDITNICFRGSDGQEASFFWTYGAWISGVSAVNFTNVNCAGSSARSGSGVLIEGNSSAAAVAINFSGCTFNNLTAGIIYGQYTQGVTVNQCNFTYCNIGVFSPPSLPDFSAQLGITNSQFNCYTAGVGLERPIAGLMINGNFFVPPNGSACINVSDLGLATIVGNTFFGKGSSGATGIHVVSSSAFSLIIGNAFVLLGIAITLAADSADVNVQSNSYQSCGTNISNAGTNNTIGGGSARRSRIPA